MIVFLSLSGYKHTRRVVYRKAWTDAATGVEYDIDSARRTFPNKPHIFKEDGKIKSVLARSAREARRILASLRAKGLIGQTIEKFETREGISPPLHRSHIAVGTAMRQLAVKMCVAVGQLMVPEIVILDEPCRQFLLDETPDSSPVRQAYAADPLLNACLPPLAHAVYVEGNARDAKCFGVVQLFGGAFRFYIPLTRSYTGRDFAVLGLLDIRTFQEDFREIAPLNLTEAPQIADLNEMERSFTEWKTTLNTQVHAAFGQDAGLFHLSPAQTIAGARVTLPLLWIEHELEIRVSLRLVLDQTPNEELTLPTNPREWILSSDAGTTTLAFLDTFVRKWNEDLLNRDQGCEHVYVPAEIGAGVRLKLGNVIWCPVDTVQIAYLVHRNGWLGTVDLRNLTAKVDRSEHKWQFDVTLNRDDVPKVRDPSWVSIPDLSVYETAPAHLLAVERRDIDLSSLRITDLCADPVGGAA